jgi:hypothetical protein
MTVGGNDLLARWISCTLNISRAMIDVTAVTDNAKTFADGTMEWSVTMGKLVEASSTFPALLVTGGTFLFTMTEAAAGHTYSGVCRISRADHDAGTVDGRQMENLTLQGEGGLTIT